MVKSKKKKKDFCLNIIGENSSMELHSIGYILEADFEYPDDLHKLHNDDPLAPENLEISKNIL